MGVSFVCFTLAWGVCLSISDWMLCSCVLVGYSWEGFDKISKFEGRNLKISMNNAKLTKKYSHLKGVDIQKPFLITCNFFDIQNR